MIIPLDAAICLSRNLVVGLTSLPGDPIHPGHISCLQSMRNAIDTLQIALNKVEKYVTMCLVNDDNFLVRKKGFRFIPLEDRLKIIDSIKGGADYVVPFTPSNPEDMTVCEGISLIRPKFFLKGGDRVADETLPEWNVCKDVGCTVIGKVGAEKVWSSSKYLEEYRKYVLSQS